MPGQAATQETKEPRAPKTPKVKLTNDERKARMQQVRKERIDAVFAGQKFDYVGPVTLDDGERYKDPMGNKGRHGFKLVNKVTAEEIIVGPGTLAKAEKMGAVTVPPKERKSRAEAVETTEAAEVPGDNPFEG